MKVSFARVSLPETGTLALPIAGGQKLGPAAKSLNKITSGALIKALKTAQFSGDREKSLILYGLPGTNLSRVVCYGVGENKGTNFLDWERIGGKLWSILSEEKRATIVVESVSNAQPESAAHLALGAVLRSFEFDKYRTTKKVGVGTKLSQLRIQTDQPEIARAKYIPFRAVADGVHLTRDLVSEPPNILYPASFAQRIRKLKLVGVKVHVLHASDMEKLGMGALLGVAQGSARPPKLVIMRWMGGKPSSAAPIAFVGKGVTFDSGGISLKPGQGMWDMKWDMGGAGTVTGLMKTLALRKAKANVVGIVGLVENMPDGKAQRPGDVVKSMSGQTIEVLNTDAEGRLILADALWYVQKKMKPRLIVDLATLTGAIVAALGKHYAGLFSNDDKLAKQLADAGIATGERLWRLPLGEEYDKQINSFSADMKNIGSRYAGSITAAQFLQRFIDKVPWAHLDIAGVTWSENGSQTAARGATGFGVRLLDQFVKDNCEN